MNVRAKPILCGTDFSLHAAEAANVAGAIATHLKVPLILLHSLEGGGSNATSARNYQAVLSGARERLHVEAERLRLDGVEVREELVSGPAHEKLVAAATRSHVRMIVVSSIGAATVRNLVIGSVAERVAESSPVPTLVVRNGPVLQSWARGQCSLKVLVGFDFSASSDCALKWLPLLKEIGSCDVTVQYIAWPPQETSRFGAHYGAWWDELPGEVQQFIERDLEARVTPFGSDVKTRVESSWGRTDLKLIELARADSFDLIIVGTHQRHGISRGWLGSISRGVLHHAPMSVAVVPKISPESDRPVVPLLRRILVMTDFSEVANTAVPYAYSLLPRGGLVRLVHVLRASSSGLGSAQHREQKRLFKETRQKLKALIPPEPETHGITTEMVVLQSNQIAPAVCAEAERFGADALCIASSSSATKRLFGSVSRSLLKRTRRPVLLIRPPEP